MPRIPPCAVLFLAMEDRMHPTTDLTLVDTDTAARIVRASPSTLAKLRMRDDGPPFVRVGKRVHYPLPRLLEWLTARLQQSTVYKVSGERLVRTSRPG